LKSWPNWPMYRFWHSPIGKRFVCVGF
jgi:hypothetical protein